MNTIQALQSGKIFLVTPELEKQFNHFGESLIQAFSIYNPTESLSNLEYTVLEDIYYFIQLGETFNDHFIEEVATKHLFRYKLIKTIVRNVYFNSNWKRLQDDQLLSFIAAYRLINRIFIWIEEQKQSNEVLRDMIDYEPYDKLTIEEKYELDYKIANELTKERFKNNFSYSRIIERAIRESLNLRQAMIDIIGKTNYRMINTEDTLYVVTSLLAGRDMIEIAFWKKRILTVKKDVLLFEETDRPVTARVICIQQDDSMHPYSNMLNGISFGLCELSNEQQRDFIYLSYAQRAVHDSYNIHGEMTIKDYFEISSHFIGGDCQVNMKDLLNNVFTMLKLELTSTGGDVWIICNEKIFTSIDEDVSWKEAVLSYKKEMNIKINVFVLGEKQDTKTLWFADRVLFQYHLAELI